MEFYDLFMLCLWWQWEPELGYAHTWTTCDKVLRILSGLEIINETARQMIPKRMDVRRFFTRSLFICWPGHFEDPVEGLRKQQERLVAYRSTSGRGETTDRLLYDVRIHLTDAGARYAERQQERYQHIITRESYLREDTRQEDAFVAMSPAAKAAIARRYRQRVGAKVAKTRGEELQRRGKENEPQESTTP